MLEHNAIVVGRHFDNLCKFQSVITLSKEPSPHTVVAKIARHEGVPLLEKPFGAVQLRVLLEKLVGPGSASGNRSRGISA